MHVFRFQKKTAHTSTKLAKITSSVKHVIRNPKWDTESENGDKALKISEACKKVHIPVIGVTWGLQKSTMPKREKNNYSQQTCQSSYL